MCKALVFYIDIHVCTASKVIGMNKKNVCQARNINEIIDVNKRLPNVTYLWLLLKI